MTCLVLREPNLSCSPLSASCRARAYLHHVRMHTVFACHVKHKQGRASDKCCGGQSDDMSLLNCGHRIGGWATRQVYRVRHFV